jgi:hypothetical protein
MGKRSWFLLSLVLFGAVMLVAALPSYASAAGVDPFSELETAAAPGAPPVGGAPQFAGTPGNSPLSPKAPTSIKSGTTKAAPAPGPVAGISFAPSATESSPRRLSGTKCKRHKGTRTCRKYRDGKVVKICVTARGRKKRCRRVKTHKASASSVGAEFGFSAPIPPSGKIFRDNLGTAVSGHCSGTLFTNGLLITAAHCLYSNAETAPDMGFTGYDIEHQRLWFAADETFGSDQSSDIASASAPYDLLPITRSWVPQCWASGNPNCDFGVAEVAPYEDGTYVGEYTGTFPLMWTYSASAGAQFYLFGYPATNAFAEARFGYGDTPFFCNDTYDDKVVTVGSSTELAALECPGNGGMSGGPVFTKAANGYWYIAGVVNRSTKGNTTGQLARSQEFVSWDYWESSLFGAFLCGNFPVCE